MNPEQKQKVVFFDGVCGLCNGFVDFVLKHDHQQAFLFSPLQSDYAKQSLPPEFTQDLKSVVVKINDRTYSKSEAVFHVFKELGGMWWALSLFKALPSPLLNWGYDLVASHRYRLFGKKETCRLPTPEERQRFVL